MGHYYLSTVVNLTDVHSAIEDENSSSSLFLKVRKG